MPVRASTRFTKLVVDSLARSSVAKRRSPSGDARPSNECIMRKAAPPASPVACERLNEAQAIERIQAGDPAVFEDLYRQHSRRVYALCLRMVKDTTEAEDLTQETFLLVFRKLHTFRGESAFSTWLHRLTVNLVLMRLTTKRLGQAAVNLERQTLCWKVRLTE
jgi:Sigma-70 region 2